MGLLRLLHNILHGSAALVYSNHPREAASSTCLTIIFGRIVSSITSTAALVSVQSHYSAGTDVVQHKAIPPELHSPESTYRVYPGFQLYVSIVRSDNRSGRWLTIQSNALRGQKPGLSL